ncbi:MAG: bifunctional polysaccharide deacetylase/glycosyltransferase family 2 protein [Actinomycetes bacterium]
MARHRRYRDPRHHWVLVSLLLGTMLCLLVINGYAEQSLQENLRRAPDAAQSEEAPLETSRPVVDLSGERPVGARVPRRTLALTFEDGPDPRWTPQILDVLRRHRVHATFFMVGSRVAAYPGLARDVVAQGHEIGSHTYTHADLGDLPDWRRTLELTLSRNIFAGVTGERVRLFRPPNSSVPAALSAAQYDAARAASSAGYLTVLADRDTHDLSGRTTRQIVTAATPKDGRGALVLLHDSGGDRTAVVQGVDRLLTRLEQRGYRFTTVSDAVGVRPATTRAGVAERVTGLAWVAAHQAGRALSHGLSIALGLLILLTVGRLLVLMILAWVHSLRARGTYARDLRRRARAARAQATAFEARAQVLQSRSRRARSRAIQAWTLAQRLSPGVAYCPSVSVIVPAHNEAMGIEATVRSLVDTSYPGEVEIVVVDDGSTDGTGAIAANLGLPRVTVIRQENAGKPAALNTGIAVSRHAVLVLVDADTVFESHTIERLVAPLSDARVGAVSGNTKVGNVRGILGRWQHIEYVIGFNLDRRMFDLLKCMPTVPGAIGAFRWTALARVGGVSRDTLAEDTDLTMAICRAGWHVVYEPTARAWTEAPSSLAQLWRQRYRWCYGTLQSMWKHRRSVRERGPAGTFGRRGLVYLALYQVLLPLLAPVVDVYALYGLAFGDPGEILRVWLAFVGLQALVGAYALYLDEERLGPLWTLPLQQFVYRQLMYLVVIQSVVTALLGAPLRWHTTQRHGTFAQQDAGRVSITTRQERQAIDR